MPFNITIDHESDRKDSSSSTSEDECTAGQQDLVPVRRSREAGLRKRDSQQSDHTWSYERDSDVAREDHFGYQDESDDRSRGHHQSPDRMENVLAGIARLTFDQYEANMKACGARRNKSAKYHHLIEVIKDHYASAYGFHNVSAFRQIEWYGSTTAKKSAFNTMVTVPDRIRINSAQVIETLFEVSGLPSGSEGFPGSLVMLRPFKLLMIYEKKIRNFYETLKEKVVMWRPGDVMKDLMTDDKGARGSPESDATVTGEAASESPESKVASPSLDDVHDHQEQEQYERSKQLLEGYESLISLLDNDLKPLIDLRQGLEDGSVKDIAFTDLWFLLRPGEEVCNRDRPSQIHRVVEVQGGRPDQRAHTYSSYQKTYLPSWRHGKDTEVFDDTPNTFTISLCCLGYNGERLGPCGSVQVVRKYKGLKPINSLPVYPIKYLDNSTREDLVRRGRFFMDLAHAQNGVAHRSYCGLAKNLSGYLEAVDSEVIIDTSMAFLKNPELDRDLPRVRELPVNEYELVQFVDPDCQASNCCGYVPIYRDFDVDQELVLDAMKSYKARWGTGEISSAMAPEDFLLCPSTMYGYVLKSRRWFRLELDFLQKLPTEDFGFDRLVLPEGHREILLALVQTRFKNKNTNIQQEKIDRQTDLVRGKGRGLVVLLHGEPGVGKTSTAECVAEYTHRPLFQITCGDIGDSAQEVEKTLEDHFQLAQKWGCVLLLDEADVFLAARNKTDLKRNAIVSVFLRAIEYYSGILFLTTNRIGAFDPAFKSRIHMSLFYPKIELGPSIEIWKKSLKRIEAIHEGVEVRPEEKQKILAFATDHFNLCKGLQSTWNGRQIRNAFQTAIALAEYEAHKIRVDWNLSEEPRAQLKVDHFRKVADSSRHFDEYVKATLGSTEADLAMERFERRDDLNVSDFKLGNALEQERVAKLYD